MAKGGAFKEELERATNRARLSYVKTHWGKVGKGETFEVSAVDVCRAERVMPVLGVLREVVYETIKMGDKGPTEYVHAFSRRDPPLLIYSQECQKIVIAGGGYRVTWRGIVG